MPFGYFVEVSGPTDPGYGIGSERPGHPPVGGGGPTDPGYGVILPPVVDNGTPPGHAGHPLPPFPGRPGGGPVRPTFPADPDYGIPNPPNVWPSPPGHAGHPLPPVRPDVPVYPVDPDYGLIPPGAVYPPLPPEAGTGKLLVIAWVVGYGYRWMVIDPSLEVGLPLPPGVPGKPKPPGGGSIGGGPAPTPGPK